MHGASDNPVKVTEDKMDIPNIHQENRTERELRNEQITRKRIHRLCSPELSNRY